MADAKDLVDGPLVCDSCGREMLHMEAGAWDGDRQIWLCHPDDEGLPDCYASWSWQEARGVVHLAEPAETIIARLRGR